MALQKDAGEDIAIRRRRLRYRAWHRGTKEMDLVLGPFADAHLEGELARITRGIVRPRPGICHILL